VKKLADGLHPGLARDDYDALERDNFSTLKWMAKSPAHYHHQKVTPFKDTDPKKLGRAVHIAALEPERYRSAVAVWDGGTRRGKDWDRFVENNEGRELLTEREHELCMAIQKAVQSDGIAAPYLRNGKGEVSMLWTRQWKFDGQPVPLSCKGRIDFLSTAIVDLKSTRNASPDGFAREVFTYRYHSQAAWYQDGLERITGQRVPYIIIAVENTPPHVVQVYTVPEVMLDLGREEYSTWLDRLVWCRASCAWPGYAEQERELEIPRWALPPDDEDLAGLDLKVGGELHGQGLPVAGADDF
jgi:hypothetical protein